ncbi:putative formamidase [Helianthus anomalus]
MHISQGTCYEGCFDNSLTTLEPHLIANLTTLFDHFYTSIIRSKTKTNQLFQDIRPKVNKLPVGPRVVRNLNFPRCTYDENLSITKNLNPNATGS